MNKVYCLPLFFLLLVSCAKNPSAVDDGYAPYTPIVSTVFAERQVFIPTPASLSGIPPASLHWAAEVGRIEVTDSGIVFFAPSEGGLARILVTAETNEPSALTVELNIYVHRQIIIFKADDLIWDRKTVLPAGWFRFIELIRSKKARAALGIIGSYLEKADTQFCRMVKDLMADGTFEIFNHGFTHQISGSAGSNPDKPSEFYRTSEADQLTSLRKTQRLAREKLGLTLRAFGAPGNAFDKTTTRIINKDPDILIWFFGDPACSKLVLKRAGEIEYPTPNPSFAEFAKRYDPMREMYVFQIHPHQWKEAQFQEFQKILDFLVEKKVTFLTPTQYYRIFVQNRIP
ncbi:MAG: DUF2334 domain-containing protein [candidate division KSB1 bacterium]|nr:DUF2334 domain-containing protein [candidate division KSB1 bacterium]MDZ7345180.1 DUF2334 domain-containing protein [candidate division KSB1 bacterium]